MSLSPMNSLGEIRRRHPSPRNPYKEVRERFHRWDRIALCISETVATWWLFLILGLGTVVWLALNLAGRLQMSPPNDFAWWSLACNFIQLLLLPLLLAGQNVQSRRDEARAENDLEIDKKSEEEVDLVLNQLEGQNQQLERQNIMLKALLERQGIKLEETPSKNERS